MSGITSCELEMHSDFWLLPSCASAEPVQATVVVPTFNTEATLGRALLSGLGQTMRSIEIIVVDDASTDRSWALICALAASDPRLRAIRNKTNRGKSVGMNRAISCANGRWLAVLDADDWYRADRLSALIDLGERRQVEMVADNQVFFDAAANRTVGCAWSPATTDWELTFDGFLEASDAYAMFNMGMLKPVMRTDFMRRTAIGYEEQARDGHDFLHLLTFYLAGGRAAISDTPYYHYTQPFGSISRQWSHLARKRYDFDMLQQLSQRFAARAQDKLTRSQRRCLRQRINQFGALEHYYRAKERLAEGDLVAAARGIARHPRLLGYPAQRVRSLLFGRHRSVTTAGRID
jgi:succinoglycan biosynthesis protein ExoO